MSNIFWILQDTGSLGKLAEWDHDVMKLEQVICPADPGHQRGGKRLTDLSVVLPRGPILDFLWTWYGECLIHDDVLDLFRRENLSGYEVKRVKARFKTGIDEPPTIWELVVKGWGGLARPESGIKRTDFCESCKHARYSDLTDAQMLIDKSQWDGSDFFMVWPMPRFVFVTERVADCFRNHRLTGATLKRSAEYKKNPAVIEGFGPGRLSYVMPESRAHELGERSGIEEI